MTQLARDASPLVDAAGLCAPPVPGETMSLSAEESLLTAVLIEGLRNAAGHVTGVEGTSRRRIQAEALLWVLSWRVEPFSFVWICQHLGLDADYVRRRRADVVHDEHLVHVRRRGRVKA